MTTARKPPLPPRQKQRRPLAQPKPPPPRPLTNALMARMKEIRDQSEGKITNQSIAEAIGKNPQDVSEYLSGWRSAPYGDSQIALILFFLPHDKNLLKDLK